MGQRGPTQQPAAIAKIKGTYRESRHRDAISETDKTLDFVHNILPAAPDYFDLDAKLIWDSQLSQAQKIYGYISFIDLRLFSEYCYVYSELEKLKKISINRTYKDDNGVLRVDPLYQELNRLRKDFLRLSQEFGFSPSARTRIQLQQKPEEDKDIYSDGI